ncbi:phenolic acid decarboxylase [Ewingella americana]|jgi:phenolic acid decarboxylase|uniref:Phenolic acid decarboxylase n=1 Tax=Ewingella americana TaxID=41202 RepID=A0A502GVH8_9GAMM|nr:phenolic acid decarboxylase [Ewingella americana]TPG64983.1 phenolic acid decarboxylase [Ewingella americana]
MSSFDKQDLSRFVGKHLVYTYDNGWNYEIYVKNANTLDYRIHSGLVGNRWVKDQQAYIVRVGQDIYKISWTEPTGTDVSLIVNLADKVFHGTIFFPRWVINNPEKTVCFQNEHIAEMLALRDAGPAYPTEVIDEFATITFVRDCGENNESVIDCAASELPKDFPAGLH